MNIQTYFCLMISLFCISFITYSQQLISPQFESESGDFYSSDHRYGMVLTAPDGSCYRIRVLNGGTVISENIACPNESDSCLTTFDCSAGNILINNGNPVACHTNVPITINWVDCNNEYNVLPNEQGLSASIGQIQYLSKNGITNSYNWTIPATVASSQQVTFSYGDPNDLCSFTTTIVCTQATENVRQLMDLSGCGEEEAFTCAEGADIYFVTNLNDAGPGSLRNGLSATQPLKIISAVSGTINLANQLTTTGCKSYLGSVASGQGLAVKYITGSGSYAAFAVGGDKVFIEHLTVASTDRWGLTVINQQDVAIRHTDVFGAADETVLVYGTGASNVTFKYNIISLGGQDKGAFSGGASKGMLVQCEGNPAGGCQNITVFGNLFANNDLRTPLVSSWQSADIYNNMVVNSGNWGVSVRSDNTLMSGNILNNWYDDPSNLGGNVWFWKAGEAGGSVPVSNNFQVYIDGNYNNNGSTEQLVYQTLSGQTASNSPPVTPHTICASDKKLLDAVDVPAQLMQTVGHSASTRATTSALVHGNALAGIDMPRNRTASQFLANEWVNIPSDPTNTKIDLGAVDGVPASWKACVGLSGGDNLNTNTIALPNQQGYTYFDLWVAQGAPSDCAGSSQNNGAN